MNSTMNLTQAPEVFMSEKAKMSIGAAGMKKKVKHVRARNSGPTLRFSPYAWTKLLAFRDYGPTEIAGFGVAHGNDPLLIEDFVTVRQSCTSVTVAMNDEAVADHFDQQVDSGFKPEQFARVWLHTHPGDSPHPSTTDEATFERVFGQCDWAIMAILARGGQTYARLRFGVGPGAQLLIPVEVDFSVPFPASNHDVWQDEYANHVAIETRLSALHPLLPDGDEGLAQLHHRRLHEWHGQDSWDDHELSDAEALALLEEEFEQQANREAMEVGFD